MHLLSVSVIYFGTRLLSEYSYYTITCCQIGHNLILNVTLTYKLTVPSVKKYAVFNSCISLYMCVCSRAWAFLYISSCQSWTCNQRLSQISLAVFSRMTGRNHLMLLEWLYWHGVWIYSARDCLVSFVYMTVKRTILWVWLQLWRVSHLWYRVLT